MLENNLPLTVETFKSKLVSIIDVAVALLYLQSWNVRLFLVPTASLWARVINRILLIQLYLVFL